MIHDDVINNAILTKLVFTLCCGKGLFSRLSASNLISCALMSWCHFPPAYTFNVQETVTAITSISLLTRFLVGCALLERSRPRLEK